MDAHVFFFCLCHRQNYIKVFVTIEAKWHINIFQICVKYFFFGNMLFFSLSVIGLNSGKKILVKSCVLVLSLG